MELVWEDPPSFYRRWDDVIAELQAHPGEWAVVREPTTKAQCNRPWRAMKERGAEAAIRKVDGIGWGVWARWNPAKGA